MGTGTLQVSSDLCPGLMGSRAKQEAPGAGQEQLLQPDQQAVPSPTECPWANPALPRTWGTILEKGLVSSLRGKQAPHPVLEACPPGPHIPPPPQLGLLTATRSHAPHGTGGALRPGEKAAGHRKLFLGSISAWRCLMPAQDPAAPAGRAAPHPTPRLGDLSSGKACGEP